MAPFTILRFESPTKWCMKSKGKVYFSLYEKHLLYVNPLRLISIWSFNYSCKKSYWKWYTVYWEPATILCIWCLNVLSCKEPCCSPFQSQRDWEEETNSNKTTNNKGLPKRSKGMFHKVSHLLTLFLDFLMLKSEDLCDKIWIFKYLTLQERDSLIHVCQSLIIKGMMETPPFSKIFDPELHILRSH